MSTAGVGPSASAKRKKKKRTAAKATAAVPPPAGDKKSIAGAKADTKSAPIPHADAKSLITTIKTRNAGVCIGYTSPHIKLTEISGCGRGYIATCDIAAGSAIIYERGITSRPYTGSGFDPRATAMDDVAVQILKRSDCDDLYESKSKRLPDRIDPSVFDSESADKQKQNEKWITARCQAVTNSFAMPLDQADMPLANKLAAAAAVSPSPAAGGSGGGGGNSKTRPPVISGSGGGGMWWVVVLYPLTSRLNHSCNPNCNALTPNAVGFRGADTVIHTLRTIRAGEQLTIEYDDQISHWPYDMRQRSLLHSHQFKCECERCTAFVTAFPSAASTATTTDSSVTAAPATAASAPAPTAAASDSGGSPALTKTSESATPAAAVSAVSTVAAASKLHPIDRELETIVLTKTAAGPASAAAAQGLLLDSICRDFDSRFPLFEAPKAVQHDPMLWISHINAMAACRMRWFPKALHRNHWRLWHADRILIENLSQFGIKAGPNNFRNAFVHFKWSEWIGSVCADHLQRLSECLPEFDIRISYYAKLILALPHSSEWLSLGDEVASRIERSCIMLDTLEARFRNT